MATNREKRLAEQWFRSLSIRQSKEFVRKHFPETFTFNGRECYLRYLDDLYARPHLVTQIWRDEGKPAPQACWRPKS